MKTKRVVIIGGPSSGKTTLLTQFEKEGFKCMPEISRAIIKKAQKEGIEQLFLEDPLLFSKMLLAGRLEQYQMANKLAEEVVFYDRGLPDITAYMNFIGAAYTEEFVETCKQNTYDFVFLLPPWKEIHTNDGERYESFEQATTITKFLQDEYKKFGHTIDEVPIGTVKERANYIKQKLSLTT